jgi:hypothetical protein
MQQDLNVLIILAFQSQRMHRLSYLHFTYFNSYHLKVPKSVEFTQYILENLGEGNSRSGVSY